MSLTTLDKLNSELQKLAPLITKDEIVLIQRKLSIDLFAGCIKRTPVDEGEARGGWQMSVGTQIPQGGTGKREVGEVGDFFGQTFQSGLASIAQLPPFSMVWITNNVKHAPILDAGLFIPTDPGPSKDPREGRFGEILVQSGFSTQAPEGIIEPTLREVLEAL